MMEKCFDEAILQAFLDNELPIEKSQTVARHIAACDECAILLAEVEEETAFAFIALEQEFNTLVPTQRLWTKINESIETQSRNRSFWQKFSAFVSGLNLMNPQIVAFGSVLLIVGVVAVLILMKDNKTIESEVAKTSENQTRKTKPTIASPVADTFEKNNPPIENTKAKVSKNKVNPQFRVEKAEFVEIKSNRQSPKIIVDPLPSRPKYLDGEESYVNTIARLEKTVDVNKDEVLKPSARFSYEKNLAVVNDSISKMKAEVRKNPKNEDAKQILFSSYQNKIELLNSVTQRGELMASLR